MKRVHDWQKVGLVTHIVLLVLTSILFVWTSIAQAQSGAQASASADSKTSAQASKSGAAASNNTSGNASAQAGKNSASVAQGSTMNAVLTKPVDCKKNKPGDTVTGKTTENTKSDGEVVIPKGSKLVGHVTEAKARGKGESESSLGIVFDKAILKNGQEVPLNANIQALAAAETMASGSLDTPDLGASGLGSASRRPQGRGCRANLMPSSQPRRAPGCWRSAELPGHPSEWLCQTRCRARTRIRLCPAPSLR